MDWIRGLGRQRTGNDCESSPPLSFSKTIGVGGGDASESELEPGRPPPTTTHSGVRGVRSVTSSGLLQF